MKRIALAAALAFAATSAFAMHCPKEMKSIDDALAKNPKLSEAQMKDVKASRAKGEEQAKDGDERAHGPRIYVRRELGTRGCAG